MSVLTLRPNAVGDDTSINYQSPDSGAHWDKVDEDGVGDGDGTYVLGVSDVYLRDLYGIPNHTSEVGSISSVKVYIRCCSFEGGYGKVAMKTGGTIYEGSEISLPGWAEWTLYSNEWLTNPQTTVVWTWSDIDALQIGVALGKGYAYCTQVYVEITYVPYIDIGLRIRTSSETIKIGVRDLEGTHKLRIRKGATTYGIPLLATNDPSASGLRIYDGANVKALPKVA